MNYEIIDVLYRSRITLLEHLASVGYNTTPYSKFSPKEITEMVKAGPAQGAGQRAAVGEASGGTGRGIADAISSGSRIRSERPRMALYY